jgi:hypothetical protein
MADPAGTLAVIADRLTVTASARGIDMPTP